MSSNLQPLPPPVGSPMVDKNGLVTKPWADFFNSIYRYEQGIDSSVDDGTYTVGIGSITNGKITLVGGNITVIQEAS